MSEELLISPQAGQTESVDLFLDGLTDLPSIPDTLLRIWQVVDDPRSSASDLEKLVSLEPPLAAKVLRVANSAYYGGHGHVGDVKAAIRVLGFETIRSMAVALGLVSQLQDGRAEAGGLDRRELWRHSVAAAVCARRLAREFGWADAERVFTAGLLHDIGMFVIAILENSAYDALARCMSSSVDTLVEAESSRWGFNHAEVGLALTRRWNLPESLTALIGAHHESPSPEDSNELRVLRLADALSNRLAPATVLAIETPEPFRQEDLAQLGISQEQLAELGPILFEDIERAREFMNLV